MAAVTEAALVKISDSALLSSVAASVGIGTGMTVTPSASTLDAKAATDDCATEAAEMTCEMTGMTVSTISEATAPIVAVTTLAADCKALVGAGITTGVIGGSVPSAGMETEAGILMEVTYPLMVIGTIFAASSGDGGTTRSTAVT